MKSKITKLVAIVSLLFTIWIFSTSVNASNERAKITVENFLTYIEEGSSYSLDYIDRTNYELYNTVQENLYSISSLDYEIMKITQEDDVYHINVKIKAEGTNWKISGIKVKFDVKQINGSYKIIDTNFFEKANLEYGEKIVFGILGGIGIVFFLIIGDFVLVTIIIIVIIIIAVKKSKKEKNNNIDKQWQMKIGVVNYYTNFCKNNYGSIYKVINRSKNDERFLLTR